MSRTKKTNKKISKEDALYKYGTTFKKLTKLGITENRDGKYKTLNEVLSSNEGMVIAQVQKNFSMDVRGARLQMKNGNSYVMAMGTYSQGKKDKVYKPYRKSFSECFNRYRGQDLNGKTLLMWRTGGLGDIVITQGVCKAIKNKFPDSKIIYATSPGFIELFKMWPSGLVNITSPIPFEKRLMDISNYHMTFIHSIENCIETNNMNYFEIFQKVSGLNYNPKDFISELIPNPAYLKEMEKHIPKNTVLIHMASTTKLRDMSSMKWYNIMKGLIDRGFCVGIIDVAKKAQDIQKYLNSTMLPRERLINLSYLDTDLYNCVAICASCIGGITIDSGITHVMGALRKPTVCVCGPYTSNSVVSYYPNHIGLDATNWNECGKYPCHFNSQEFLCPYLVSGKCVGCIDSIPEDKIIETFEQALKLKNNSKLEIL